MFEGESSSNRTMLRIVEDSLPHPPSLIETWKKRSWAKDQKEKEKPEIEPGTLSIDPTEGNISFKMYV